MLSGKLFWLTLVHFTIFKGYCLSVNQSAIEGNTAPQNTTFYVPTESTTTGFSTTRKAIDVSSIPVQNTSLRAPALINSTSVSKTQLEIVEIFHGHPNSTATVPAEQISLNRTGTTNCLNISSGNLTYIHRSWNDTFKSNYSTVAEAVAASEGSPAFRLQNTAAIAVGVFLVSAVIGYLSCVGYRRFLQRKYGNSRILIGEEVYDTTDLRYFEI